MFRRSEDTVWHLWLTLLGVSAFGPFFDLVTGQPINWLFGALVLLMLAVAIWQRSRSASGGSFSRINRLVASRPAGIAFGLYVVYYAAHAFRPDTNALNTLLALRWPLIGFAAYWITASQLAQRGEGRSLIKSFLLMVTIVTAAVAIYGLFQYAVGLEQLKAWGLAPPDARLTGVRTLGEGVEIFRIFGPLRRNEAMGAFMVLGLVGTLCGHLMKVSPRWSTAGVMPLGLAALVLTMSLASIGTLIIWFFLIIVLLPTNKKRLIGPLLLLVAAPFALNILSGGLLFGRLQQHVIDARQGRGRLEETLDWAGEMGDRPLAVQMIGTGVCTGINSSTLDRVEGIFAQLGIRIDESDLFNCGWQREVQDTWYGTMSLEIGWLGLVLFWLPFAVLAFWQVPALLRKRESRPGQVGAIMALAAVAFWPSGWVGALIAYMPVTAYFWSMVALAEGGTQERANDARLGPKE